MKLKGNLQPTDFADAEVRVSEWVLVSDLAEWRSNESIKAYRVWMCRCSSWWFQRHEWATKQRNSTDFDAWSLSGYWPRKEWPQHMKPAPETDDI